MRWGTPLRWLASGAVVSLISLAAGTGPAKADAVFGTSLNGGCSATLQPSPGLGHICGTSLTFANSTGGTITATAFSGAPGTTTPEDLTQRLIADVGASEAGLGENTVGSSTCTDADCEIGGGLGGHSVLLTASAGLTQIDVFVGSAQPNEAFDLWTNSGGSLIDLGTITPTATTCPGDVCHLTFGPATMVGIQNDGTGNVVLSSVSTPALPPSAPEPASLAILGTALAGFGFVARRRRRS